MTLVTMSLKCLWQANTAHQLTLSVHTVQRVWKIIQKVADGANREQLHYIFADGQYDERVRSKQKYNRR